MLIQNEFFDLFLQDDDVLIRTNQEGYALKSFDLITREYPRIKIESFTTLRNALTEVGTEQVIGNWIPLIEATISSNKMSVELIINATIIEINDNRTKILTEAENILDKLGVTHGRQDLSNEVFLPGKAIVGAVGTEPIKGEDALLTYIERPERKPVIREDGSADYYEMNFVFPVDQDDWIGEKIPPQAGIDGTDILGNVIAAIRGSDAMLNYDRKSVIEVVEEDKVVLRALHAGALEYINDVVGVGKQLTISGDVGPETGSIIFEGAVVVYGTITAGYSVHATGDISIEGMEGVTNAKGIQSSEGAVFIKGGIFGGDETVIEAQGSVYLKYANNCKIYAKEVHVGLYLFSSEVIADHIYLDKNRGKIIGGTLKALYSIECAIVGNSHEMTTNLYATGIDKNSVNKEIQEMALDLKKRKEVVEGLEGQLAQFSKSGGKLTYEKNEAVNKIKDTIKYNKIVIAETNIEIRQLLFKVKEAVPAKIDVTKEAYPGTIIQIGKYQSVLHDKTKGVFQFVDGVLNI